MQISNWAIIAICTAIFVLSLVIIRHNSRQARIVNTSLVIIYTLMLMIGVLFSVKISNTTARLTLDLSGKFCDIDKISLYDLTPTNIVINLMILLPYAPHIRKVSHKNYLLNCLMFGVFIGLSIELIQFILPVPRTVELTDILYNAISLFLGGIIVKFTLFVVDKRHKKP